MKNYSIKDIIHSFISSYNRRKLKLREKGIFSYMFNSSGYVLIIALLVISLLVSISTEFFIVAQTNMNYLRKFSERLKASTLAKAGVNLSKFILQADKSGIASALLGTNTDKNIDSYNDIWAIDFPVLPLENGDLAIAIYDENSKINLSVLANEVVEQTQYYAITQRFFMNMGFPIDIVDAIIDWVDVDDSRHPYGAESSDYYQSLQKPYNAKNRAMDSIDELLLIKGITPEIFYGLGGGTHGMEENLVHHNRGTENNIMNILEEMDTDDIPEEISNLKGLKSEDEDTSIEIGKEKSRKLSDYLRVHGHRSDYLNELNKININTASYRVLSAISDNMTDEIVNELINRRTSNPFKSVDEVKDLIEDESIRKNISFYYMLTA